MEPNNILPEDAAVDASAVKRVKNRIRAFLARLRSSDELPGRTDYRQPYLILFNGVTSALDALEQKRTRQAQDILQDAQLEAIRLCLNHQTPEHQ